MNLLPLFSVPGPSQAASSVEPDLMSGVPGAVTDQGFHKVLSGAQNGEGGTFEVDASAADGALEGLKAFEDFEIDDTAEKISALIAQLLFVLKNALVEAEPQGQADEISNEIMGTATAAEGIRQEIASQLESFINLLTQAGQDSSADLDGLLEQLRQQIDGYLKTDGAIEVEPGDGGNVSLLADALGQQGGAGIPNLFDSVMESGGLRSISSAVVPGEMVREGHSESSGIDSQNSGSFLGRNGSEVVALLAGLNETLGRFLDSDPSVQPYASTSGEDQATLGVDVSGLMKTLSTSKEFFSGPAQAEVADEGFVRSGAEDNDFGISRLAFFSEPRGNPGEKTSLNENAPKGQEAVQVPESQKAINSGSVQEDESVFEGSLKLDAAGLKVAGDLPNESTDGVAVSRVLTPSSKEDTVEIFYSAPKDETSELQGPMVAQNHKTAQRSEGTAASSRPEQGGGASAKPENPGMATGATTDTFKPTANDGNRPVIHVQESSSHGDNMMAHNGGASSGGMESGPQQQGQFNLAAHPISLEPRVATGAAGEPATQVVRQLEHGITQAISMNKSRAVLHLNPPELGSVTVRISVNSHSNDVRAVFITDNPDTRHLISTSMDSLRNHLASNGFSLTGADVGQHGMHAGTGQGGGHGFSAPQQHRFEGAEPAVEVATSVTQPEQASGRNNSRLINMVV